MLQDAGIQLAKKPLPFQNHPSVTVPENTNLSEPEKAIFRVALSLDDIAHRSQFLDYACSNNVALRREIESLLAEDAAANTFMSMRKERFEMRIES